MKTKRIFRNERQWYKYDPLSDLVSHGAILLIFFILLLINPKDSIVEASNADNDLFTNNIATTEHTRGVHRLFRKPPNQDQSTYIKSFQYSKSKGLSTVAKEYGVSVKQILELNSLSSESVIPEGMLLYSSTIPGKIFVNADNTSTLYDIIQKLQISDNTKTITYNGGKKLASGLLLIGSPVLILSEDITQDNKDLISTTDNSIFDMTIFEYESIKSQTEKPSYHQAAIPETKPPQLRVGQGNITKTRKPKIRETNGMIAGHCTFYAAHKAKFLFPEIKPGLRQRIIKGNANERLSSAKKNGFTTSNTPSVGAVVVFKNGGSRYFSAGHVAIVEKVDMEHHQITVSEMNYAGLGIVNERIIQMNTSMTESLSSTQDVLGFIPVQELPKGI